MATDFAEFIGAALALNLLFGIPLFAAGLVTAIAAFGILELQRHSFRLLEAAISDMVRDSLRVRVPNLLCGTGGGQGPCRALTPQFVDTNSVLVAAGILGATVMTHVIYPHSTLTQRRVVCRI